jgi:catalase (peroxidase I)
LLGLVEPESDEMYTTAIPKLKSKECAKDTCCVWTYIADDMKQRFTGKSGRCNKLARGAVRLGFHDAGTWQKGLDYGGADGSILLTDEINRPENSGLAEIAKAMLKW